MSSVVGPLWILEDGYSMQFDGTDDYIDTSFTIPAISTYSFSVWVKHSGTLAAGYAGVFGDINSAGQSASGRAVIAFRNTAGTIYFSASMGDGSNYWYDNTTYDAGAIFDDAWHHIALTVDGVTQKLYIDGSLVHTYTSSVAAGTIGARSYWIGNAYESTSGTWDGNIDEVAIWDKVLTPAEVSALYSNGRPIKLHNPPFNPIAWYRMGDNGEFKDPQWLLPENSNKDKNTNYSMNFDGTDDYIGCGNGSTLQITSNISISCWFKTSFDASGTAMILLSKRNSALGGTSLGYQLYINSSNVLVFLITLNGVNTYQAFGTTIINDGQWHHILGTINQNVQISLILDGSTEAIGAIGAQTYIDSGTPFKLGYNQVGAAHYYFDGLMDEVSVFDALVSSGDLRKNGNPADLSNVANLVAWYHMGENSTYKYPQWLLPNNENKDKESNYSLLFDGGDDSITTGLDCSSATHPSITVSCWLKYPAEPPYHYGIYYAAGVQSANGHYQGLGLMNAGKIASKANGVWTTGTNLRDNTWHNVIWVCEYNTPAAGNMTINVYLDGNTTPDISTIDTSGGQLIGNLFIGSYDGTAWYFDGNIDEVAMWGSALTTSDVTTIYNLGTPANLSSLSPLGWWRMGDLTYSAGTADIWVVPDSSINNNTGFADNMTLDTRVGDAPNSINNALSYNMEIFDRVGDAPGSTNNALSYNMELSGRTTDVPT
jgi:hypothetical protein